MSEPEWIPKPAPGDHPDAADTRAYLSTMASAQRVAFDFRSKEPRYRVIRKPPGLRTVYVFTDRFIWDHIAGVRLTQRGAERLGRRAVQKASKLASPNGATAR